MQLLDVAWVTGDRPGSADVAFCAFMPALRMDCNTRYSPAL